MATLEVGTIAQEGPLTSTVTLKEFSGNHLNLTAYFAKISKGKKGERTGQEFAKIPLRSTQRSTKIS